MKLLSTNFLKYFGCIAKRNIKIDLQNKAFINGKWISSIDNATFPIYDPANGELIADVTDLNTYDIDEAISAADNAFNSWKRSTALDRSRILRKMNDIVLSNEEQLSYIITLENGKSLNDSRTEVKYAASFLEWFSEECRRITGEIVSSPKPDRRMTVIKQPIGAVGVITPWNFPLAMLTRKLGALLAAGCTAVIKPAEDTPLTAIKFMELIQDTVPPGVINLIPTSRSNTPAIGRALCNDRRIKSITFTGSSEVGKILYKQSADSMKRLSFELGGNAPFLVFNSANLDVAVNACFASKFRNSGQTCISSNRILVQSDILDEFLSRLVKKSSSELVVGPGLNPSVNQGPLINRDALRKVEQLISRAVQSGARVHLGGHRCENTKNEIQEGIVNHYGNFFEPTVISGTNTGQELDVLHNTEIFGPVAAVTSFKTEAEAIEKANSLTAGLASYVMTEDYRQAYRISEELEFGMVGINEGLISSPEIPFCGWKESGLGVESGRYGIHEYLHTKYVLWGNIY